MRCTLAALLPIVLLFFIKGCSTGALSTNIALAPNTQEREVQQSVPQILASIEEKLKTLDEAIRGPPQQKSVKKEVDLEGLARRLEAVETRLARIEGSLDTRLNTLSENLGRRQGKDELHAETTNKKLQSISDTISTKMGYLEAKIDEKFNTLTKRIEKCPIEMQSLLQKEFSSSSTCCQQLTGIVASVETRLKKEVTTVDKNMIVVQESLKRFEGKFFNLMTDGHSAIMELIRSEVKNLDVKVREISMDLWGKSIGIERQVQQSSAVTNLTYNHILELIRRSGHQNYGGHQSYGNRPQQYGSQVPEVSVANGEVRIMHKLNQLGREMEFRLSSIQDIQTQFKSSCRRIQDREIPTEKSIENYLVLIYEKFLNETTETKRIINAFNAYDLQTSGDLYKLLEKLQDMQNSLKDNEDVIIGDAKNMFRALNVLKEEMHKYFKDFNTETVATKVTEDLKPILLKFVDESVLESGSQSKDTSIFQELEAIISQNKNNSVAIIEPDQKPTNKGVTKPSKDEDLDYIEEQAESEMDFSSNS